MKIEPQQVHIWHLTLLPENENQLHTNNILNAAEMARADRFRFVKHKNHYLHAHILLRRILASYMDCDARNIQFSTSQHGKPYVDHPNTALQFNISHSEHEFVCIIHESRAVGIDIEIMKTPINLALAKRYFKDAEYRALLQLNGTQQVDAFYFLWSGKEAVVKAAGQTLMPSLNQFTVDVSKDHQLIQFHDMTWQLKALNLCSTFKTTIACDTSVKEIVYCHFIHDRPDIKHSQSL